MAHIGTHALVAEKVVDSSEARLSIASSALLYGLSVYSVVHLKKSEAGWLAFRLADHLKRIRQSGRLIGFSEPERHLDPNTFISGLTDLLEADQPATDQFCRITLHATSLVPGVRTSKLDHLLSAFLYEAEPILPVTGARIKTSLWRRTADTAIPARAKVNGAYVNSALAKQEAIDCGYDDALFLNQNGYVSELSAANIFFVKRGELITPDLASDILEGITRRSIIELAQAAGITVTERKVALTELYTADEIFACGTSAAVAPITELDNRTIDSGQPGAITTALREQFLSAQKDPSNPWVTVIKGVR